MIRYMFPPPQRARELKSEQKFQPKRRKKHCSSKTTEQTGKLFFLSYRHPNSFDLVPHQMIFSVHPYICIYVDKLRTHITIVSYYMYYIYKTQKYKNVKYKKNLNGSSFSYIPVYCYKDLGTGTQRRKKDCIICTSVTFKRRFDIFFPLLIIHSFTYICFQSICYLILRL